MVDYVERLDALKELALLDTGEEEYTDNISRIRATIAISNIPAADVVPVVHGRWKKIGVWGRVYRCNQCGNFLDFDAVNAGRGDANFCPNCGAKMDG